MKSMEKARVEGAKKGTVGRKKKAPVVDRVVWVYFDTPQEAAVWKRTAKKANMSTSTFVREIVDKHLANHGTVTERKELEERFKLLAQGNEDLKEENRTLKKQLERLDKLCTDYEKEIRNLENKEFLDKQGFEGVRKYQERLIELFKDKNYLNKESLFDELGIDSMDSKAIQAVSNQIDNLLEYGMIKLWRGGYQWLG